jgi:hypothetical protein
VVANIVSGVTVFTINEEQFPTLSERVWVCPGWVLVTARRQLSTLQIARSNRGDQAKVVVADAKRIDEEKETLSRAPTSTTLALYFKKHLAKLHVLNSKDQPHKATRSCKIGRVRSCRWTMPVVDAAHSVDLNMMTAQKTLQI